ncbi:MAG: 2-phospho-L-lactate guanylyltransferase [Actinobacteria bacterium]|nr:2-phospho-L-lactate guanylyltransferase [Actinomycetota bacterium]
MSHFPTPGPPHARKAPGVRWAVVLPVKRLERAKTRLRDATGSPEDHQALALALALDTARAALACPGVVRLVVVTDDERARLPLRELGAHVVPDLPGQGLNAALAFGADQAATGTAGLAGTATGVCGLSADLPALRPEDLADALAEAGRHRRSFVADATGTGTTLLAASPGTSLDPRFGPRSRWAHLASGATELTGPWRSLRRDVDTAEDLAHARELGVGPATEAALAGRWAR